MSQENELEARQRERLSRPWSTSSASTSGLRACDPRRRCSGCRPVARLPAEISGNALAERVHTAFGVWGYKGQNAGIAPPWAEGRETICACHSKFPKRLAFDLGRGRRSGAF
jgi:hypothetical protein